MVRIARNSTQPCKGLFTYRSADTRPAVLAVRMRLPSYVRRPAVGTPTRIVRTFCRPDSPVPKQGVKNRSNHIGL